MQFSVLRALGVALLATLLSAQTQAADDDPLTNAPYSTQDKFPPYPPLTNADGSNITIDNLRGTRLYGWKGCEVAESKAIAEAFNDFHKLASPLSYKINWADEVAQDFWGRNSGANRVPDDRRTQIQQIFKAQQQMYAIGWHLLPPYWTSLWIEVRCSGGDETGDPDNVCKDKTPNDGHCGRGGSPENGQDNRLEAYSDTPTRSPELTYSRLTFCTGFFNLPSLSEAITNARGKSRTARAKLDSWNNRARVFLHETTHLEFFMNTPKRSPLVDDLKFDWKERDNIVRDWVYGPYLCKMLRNYGQGTEVAFYPQRNADSFAWFALGNYIQQVTGTYPRRPRPTIYPIEDPMNSDEEDVKPANADPAEFQGQPPEDVVADGTGDPPEYAEGYSAPSCPDVDMTKDSLSSDTGSNEPNETSSPPEASNACHGISGDYWVMSRDVAVENVKDFCSQTEATKTYNVGSVNELELSVRLNTDPRSPTDAPDCLGQFQNAVIDGCDSTDPIHNPNNYKFGSTLTTADGWQYEMVPLSKQVNEVSCDVSYKFWYNYFEVRGKNWPSAALGTGGEGLRQELSGCGAITKWKFELTPDDCCFQWYASGQLPIGTKACVGRAVQSAGGSLTDNCHGAGKRNQHYSIDDWPGYGDDSKHVFRNKTLA